MLSVRWLCDTEVCWPLPVPPSDDCPMSTLIVIEFSNEDDAFNLRDLFPYIRNRHGMAGSALRILSILRPIRVYGCPSQDGTVSSVSNGLRASRRSASCG